MGKLFKFQRMQINPRHNEHTPKIFTFLSFSFLRFFHRPRQRIKTKVEFFFSTFSSKNFCICVFVCVFFSFDFGSKSQRVTFRFAVSTCTHILRRVYILIRQWKKRLNTRKKNHHKASLFRKAMPFTFILSF